MANVWKIIFEREAKKTLRQLPRGLRERIVHAIDELAENPRPAGSLKLAGYKALYRRRVGDWRIIYAVYDDELIVLVIEVAARGSAYKDL